MSNLTNAQEKAIEEVKKILLLHFDSFILTMRASDENNQDIFPSEWHGPFSDVIGLLRISSSRLDYLAVKSMDESEL